MLYGADVGKMRQLAGEMDDGAERPTEIAATIDNQLAGESWAGPDAGEFRDLWEGGGRAARTAAANDLHEAVQTLQHNADEQERASTADDVDVGVAIGAGASLGQPVGHMAPAAPLPATPVGPNSSEDERSEANYLGPEMQALRDSIPTDASPEEVREWWDNLSGQEQEDLARAWPLDLYHLDGIPRDVKKHLEGGGPYNRMETPEYALDNWDNDSINIFDNGAGNCANFVSHSMEAGGMDPHGFMSKWGYFGDKPWFEEGRGGIFDKIVPDTNVSDSWSGASAQYEMWKDTGHKDIPSYAAEPGDVIYFEKASGVIYHSAVIRAIGPDGTIYWAQHTPGSTVRSDANGVGKFHVIRPNKQP